MAIIIDGKLIARTIQEQLKLKIDQHLKDQLRKPHLVVFLIGDDYASQIYVNHKIKICEALKIKVTLKSFSTNIKESELLAMIAKENSDPLVDAILIQLPLPKNLNKTKILQHIAINKDVDGLHHCNAGKLFQGMKTIYPCTAIAVIKILEWYHIALENKTITMIGTSNLVGKPLAMLLLERKATVTMCNQNTIDIRKHTISSDIVISAVGIGNLIDETMIKPNAVVIDIGIVHNQETNMVYGDVKFNTVKEKASYITPVPNGVGPVTIAMLVQNIYDLYVINCQIKNS